MSGRRRRKRDKYAAGKDDDRAMVVSASCRELNKRNTLSSEMSNDDFDETCAPSRSDSTVTLRYV